MTDPYAPSMTGLYEYYSEVAEEPDCDITDDEATDVFLKETGRICKVAYPDLPEMPSRKDDDYKEEY